MTGSDHDRWSTPTVSVLVCTRNRGASATATVVSALAQDHPSFEVVVVDQSDDDTTEAALQEVVRDPRVRYHRSSTRGVGAARNVAAGLAAGEVLAYTDDDCRLTPGWIDTLEQLLHRNPQLGIVFGNVVAGDHDPSAGFIPAYVRTGTVMVDTMRGKCRARGIGASMAVRSSALADVGGFDELLGPGGRFRACEDGDLALRLLLRGWAVGETDRCTVLHDGFRRFSEGRTQSQNDWFGIGAAYVKPIRRGHVRASLVLAYEAALAVRKPLRALVTGRRPSGGRQIVALVRGAAAGWRTPIDPATLRFRTDGPPDGR